MNKQPSWFNEYQAYFHFKNGKKLYAKYKGTVTEAENDIQRLLNTKYKNDDLFVALYCKDYFHQDVFIKMITKENITQYNFITNNYQNIIQQNMEQNHYKTFGEMWQGDTLYGITLYYNNTEGIVIDYIFEQAYTMGEEEDSEMLTNERFKRIWLNNISESIWVGQKDRLSTFMTTPKGKVQLRVGSEFDTTRTFYFLDKNVIPAIIAYYTVMIQDAIREYQKEAERMFIFADKVLGKIADWGDTVTYEMGDCISLLDKNCLSIDNAYDKPNYEIIKTKRECPQ